MLKFIYTIFIGVLFATLVGVGIAAFYESPKPPDYSTTPVRIANPNGLQTAEEIKKQEQQQIKYDQEYKIFQEKDQEYNRNVSIISLIIALFALIISLTLFKRLYIIADGLLLGGVLTLIYSIIRGFGAEDNIFRFVVVAIGFVIAVVLGYIKFVPKESPKK
ncbi:MAG: hypothetical protein H0W89_05610 [Candidatus Levybacteria bacterium]|nr:hypothetical protein [Candidatus Levybacteria bacterium]